MPRNGSGGYSPPQNSWNPAINGMGALPNDWMAILNDMAAAIQASIAADGQTPITGSLDFGNNRLRNVGAPQVQGDGLRFEQLMKGADVASAATIAFPIEGALFDVTGTTTITGIAGAFPGRMVLARFKASLTLKNGTNLLLPGGADIAITTGDVVLFVCLDGTKWQSLVYLAGGMLPVLGTAATKDITTSATDTTAGRVLKVGDWGIGGVLPVINGIDLLADDRYYEYYATAAVNAPAGAGITAGYVKKETRSSSYRKVTFTPFNLSTGPWVNVCNNGVWAGWVELYHSGNLPYADLQWLGNPIGGYITPLTPPPTDDPRFRYVLCTAGETGSGGYNEGILTDETVTGSAPLIEATAKVSLAGSPFDGLTIHHINTEGRFVGAGAAEAFEDDKFQGFRVGYATGSYVGNWRVQANSGSGIDPESLRTDTGASLIPISDGVNGTPRTGDHTQPRAHRLIHYRRIL